jgi:hypothetical protein
LGGRRKQ